MMTPVKGASTPPITTRNAAAGNGVSFERHRIQEILAVDELALALGSGARGIRTPEALASLLDFKSSAFDHSAIAPVGGEG